MHDLIILYSGGSDSRLLFRMAVDQGRKPLLVNVRYGQDYTHHDHPLPIECRMVGITGLFLDFKKTYGDDIAQDYIPNRNMMLISVAAAIAEQEGINEIWYGANRSDIENRYPDCYPQWVTAMNRCLPKGILLIAPLQWLTQEEVIAKLET